MPAIGKKALANPKKAFSGICFGALVEEFHPTIFLA